MGGDSRLPKAGDKCAGGGRWPLKCRQGFGGKGGGMGFGSSGCCNPTTDGPWKPPGLGRELMKPPLGPPDKPGVCGSMTGTLMGSESGGELAEASEEESTGVVGPDNGEFLTTGEVTGESLAAPPSKSELLPIMLLRPLPKPLLLPRRVPLKPSNMVCLLC